MMILKYTSTISSFTFSWWASKDAYVWNRVHNDPSRSSKVVERSSIGLCDIKTTNMRKARFFTINEIQWLTSVTVLQWQSRIYIDWTTDVRLHVACTYCSVHTVPWPAAVITSMAVSGRLDGWRPIWQTMFTLYSTFENPDWFLADSS